MFFILLFDCFFSTKAGQKNLFVLNEAKEELKELHKKLFTKP